MPYRSQKWLPDRGLNDPIDRPTNQIDRPNAPRVVPTRSFHKRRTRDDEGKTLVEGHRLVCDLIEGGHKPSLVIVSPEVRWRSEHLSEVGLRLIELALPSLARKCGGGVHWFKFGLGVLTVQAGQARMAFLLRPLPIALVIGRLAYEYTVRAGYVARALAFNLVEYCCAADAETLTTAVPLRITVYGLDGSFMLNRLEQATHQRICYSVSIYLHGQVLRSLGRASSGRYRIRQIW